MEKRGKDAVIDELFNRHTMDLDYLLEDEGFDRMQATFYLWLRWCFEEGYV